MTITPKQEDASLAPSAFEKNEVIAAAGSVLISLGMTDSLRGDVDDTHKTR